MVLKKSVSPKKTLQIEQKKERFDPDKLALICKALGHPTRLKIVAYLKEADRCICGEIVDILPLAQSTVSQHLKILKESGLVKGEIEGSRTCYCLDKRKLKTFKGLVKKI